MGLAAMSRWTACPPGCWCCHRISGQIAWSVVLSDQPLPRTTKTVWRRNATTPS
jgi:hypothetical protein